MEEVIVQLECLQEIGYYEARDQGSGGMLATMLVARNRVLDDRFPDDFCSVMNQHKQFSFVDEVTNRRMAEVVSRELASQLAYMVYYSGDKPYLNNAMYYHADYIKPNWNYNKLELVDVIGNHIFYKDAG